MLLHDFWEGWWISVRGIVSDSALQQGQRSFALCVREAGSLQGKLRTFSMPPCVVLVAGVLALVLFLVVPRTNSDECAHRAR